MLREDDDGDWKTGTVVVRGGKVSWQYADSYNTQNTTSNETECIDFGQLNH